MSRFQLLSDAQWSLIESMLPKPTGRPGRRFSDARVMLEGIIYRYRCGIEWRDLPEAFGPWQTVWTWHHRLATEGAWDTIVSTLIAEGLVDWPVSADSTIARAHQRATNTTRPTGGWIELHESGRRAAWKTSSGAVSRPATPNSPSPTAAASSSAPSPLWLKRLGDTP